MADLKTKFAMEDLRAVAFGSITAAYSSMGDSFENPAIQITIMNLTDTTLTFSTDGIKDKIKLPPNAYWLPDITSNQQGLRGGRFPAGTLIYVKAAVGYPNPTTGSADLVVCYFK